jgi:DNA-binding transcriptional regulator/RsmH inhibitor MraZ
VGDAIMRGLDRLLDGEDEIDRAGLALVAMDRYLKLTLDPDGRLSLPVNLAHHLEAIVHDAVRLVVDGSRLLLWSERVWQNNRSSRLELVAEKLRIMEEAAVLESENG